MLNDRKILIADPDKSEAMQLAIAEKASLNRRLHSLAAKPPKSKKILC
jgi:hypothetical protein